MVEQGYFNIRKSIPCLFGCRQPDARHLQTSVVRKFTQISEDLCILGFQK